MAVPDIVLFPHCDLHVSLNGTPGLNLRVMLREVDPADPTRFTLTDATALCTFDFFAPYNPVGTRLANLPSVTPATGAVTATHAGIYLFVVHLGNHCLTARLQVHANVLGWWFGNASITTAIDGAIAHAQPSIYALFSEDPSGTDRVGDITGHGYVTLASQTPAVFSVSPTGRLQGLTADAGTLRGTFLGVTHDLPVRVRDYTTPRNTLDGVKLPNLGAASEMHNILFVPEGFRDSADDRRKFDEIVTKVVDEMFSKPRHAPYNILAGSFNIWKAYEPSAQHGVTCAFRVNDEDVASVLNKGFAIPYEGGLTVDTTKYTVELLVRLVGLPARNEARDKAQLLALWNSQSLDAGFNPALVEDAVVTAWKGQKSLGILEARDTVFGFRLGARPADRLSRAQARAVPPANDAPADANLRPFIARLYQWFTFEASRSLLPDPRRHPPERLADPWSDANPGTSVMRYFSSLRWRFAPHPHIGPVWIPDTAAATFKPSRGFVAVITHDALIGGSNVCDSTMTANTLAHESQVSFQYANAGNERVMRRSVPDPVAADVDAIIDTVAHEFGHSFNLLDEYEDFPGNDPGAGTLPNIDFGGDNVTRMAAVFANGTIQPDGSVAFNTSDIDPAKVKWFSLLRMEASDALVRDSETSGGRIRVTIDKRFIGTWVAAKAKNTPVNLRARDLTPKGQQLPLKTDSAHVLVNLDIGDIDQAQGTILLGGGALPPQPFPVFPKGSVLFVPLRNKAHAQQFVVETKVADRMGSTRRPLNKDTDITKVNKEEDSPIDIPDFKPPCKSYKLVGLYEGATHWAGRSFRPAGLCKMRKSGDSGTGDGEFCHVCKWLIVNRVDPGLHALLDKSYYPKAKKNG